MLFILIVVFLYNELKRAGMAPIAGDHCSVGPEQLLIEIILMKLRLNVQRGLSRPN
jgi:hypothetical protein